MKYILLSKADGFLSDVDGGLLDKDPKIADILKNYDKDPVIVSNRLPYNGVGIVEVSEENYKKFSDLGWPVDKLFFDKKTKQLQLKRQRTPRIVVENCQSCGADLTDRKDVSQYAQFCYSCLDDKRRKRSRDLISEYRKDPDFKIHERFKILGIYYAKKGRENAYKTVEDYAEYLYKNKGITSKWFPGP